MAYLTPENWIARYETQYEGYEVAADLAVDAVREALAGRTVDTHSITGRAKTVDSARNKIQSKGYTRPAAQVTDLIGVRVITLYQADVAQVAGWLREKFETDDRYSVDKTASLGLREFGYRSVHLSLLLGKSGQPDSAGTRILARTRIEVQVRSLMEHAWAEAEHELRYKSGVPLPSEIQRRFNALSAVLEVADRELDRLHDNLFSLIDHELERCQRSEGAMEPLNSASLIASLQYLRPELRLLGPRKTALTFPQAVECLSALREVGISTRASLSEALSTKKYLDVARSYAALGEIEPGELSGIAVTSIVVGLVSSATLGRYPKLNDTQIASLVAG